MASKDQQYARQTGRGRQADAPSQIPFSGWKDICWRLYRAIGEDRVMFTSAGATFYILLALVPTLNAFVSIYGLFNDASSVLRQVELLAGVIPPGALDIVRDQLTRLTAQSTESLGLSVLLSLLIALWSSSAGVRAMFQAMNIAYNEEERRSIIVFNGTAMLFAFVGALSAVLIVSVVLVIPAIVSILPWSEGLGWAVRVAAYIAMLLVLSFGVAALYRWGPSREHARWRWITPGTVLTVVLLGATSVLFSWYVSNFSDDSATYGSLSAVIGLMIWLWISSTIVIVGAELNAEVEHQTARDTTTGHPEPLGDRGAYMADTVGRVWPMARKKVEESPTRKRRKFPLGALSMTLPLAFIARFGKGRTARTESDAE